MDKLFISRNPLSQRRFLAPSVAKLGRQPAKLGRKTVALYQSWTKPLRGGNGAAGLNSKCNLIPFDEGLFHNKP